MNTEACCCTNTDHITGCMVCGRELFYTPDKPLRAIVFTVAKNILLMSFVWKVIMSAMNVIVGIYLSLLSMNALIAIKPIQLNWH